ncbi:MAG: peptidoglycan DD-metalloendopeptidase family protein [Acutalibacteraceae bacterium]
MSDGENNMLPDTQKEESTENAVTAGTEIGRNAGEAESSSNDAQAQASAPEEAETDNEEDQEAADSYSQDSYYYDDEESYYVFDGKEAAEIIEPVEFTGEEQPASDNKNQPSDKKDVKKNKKPSFKKQLTFFITSIPFYIETLGSITVKTIKNFFEKYGIIIAIPFLLLFSAVKKLFIKIKDAFTSMPKTFSTEAKGIRYELKIIRQQAKIKDGEKKPSLVKALWKYFVLSFSRHSLFWKSVFNTVFPIAVIAVALSVFSLAGEKTFALDVIYNGTHIGYIEDEATFEKARSRALKLLPASVGTDQNESLEQEPAYKIARISLNELSNENMLCENLIEATDSTLVKACGIYIDGEFLCAVSNESDAVSVFNGIIAPAKARAASGTIVAFVEEISYVQGLYPNNEETIWDSLKLKNTLRKPKTEAVYHKVQKGDTAKSVAKKYSLTIKQLKALNPDYDFTKIQKGSKLLVAAETNYVRIKVMKTTVKTQTVPFETITKNSATLNKGSKKVSQQGVKGINQITELVTYINGEKSYSTVISKKQIKAPVDKIILVGTKSVFSGSSSDNTSVPSSSSGFIWPARGAYSLSSRYGYRSPSISGWSFHGGVDIVRGGGNSTGVPVVAAASGTVVVAVSGYSGYGHTVVIDHGNGLQTRYAHMQSGSITVHVGQKVYQGQQIGKIGSTGNVTGPHLHFEVLKNGSKVNPLSYIG